MDGNSERASGLACLPIISTVAFYTLPLNWQSSISIQFFPQISAYVALALWTISNDDCLTKLGLNTSKFCVGIKWGIITGVFLGCFNTFIILSIVPSLGGDITFLRDTPHAKLPFWVMVPGFIFCIACFVELNFRGFLLGRLVTWLSQITKEQSLQPRKAWLWFSVCLSSLIFSFDPFMVATFGSLHWIAVWDGLIWGWMWVRMTNLYAVIIAHAVEVIILYLTIRAALL